MSLKTKRYRPTVEPLEGRLAPAVIVAQLDLDDDGTADDIRIRGDSGKNVINISDDGSAALTISIDANGDGDTGDPGDTPATPFAISMDSVVLDVRLGGGADQFVYSVPNNYSTSGRTLLCDLGGGSDSFGFTSTSAIEDKSFLTLDVNGGAGKDDIDVFLNVVNNSTVDLRVALGSGADGRADDPAFLFLGTIQNLGTVQVLYDLGPGNNFWTGYVGNVGKTSGGFLDLDVLGGNRSTDSDQVTLTLDGQVATSSVPGRLDVDVRLQAGNDAFNAKLVRSSFGVADHGQFQLAVDGGAGNDDQLVETFGAMGSMTINGWCGFRLNGGAGADSIVINLFAEDVLDLYGVLSVRMHGGTGADDCSLSLAVNDGSAGAYDLAIFGNGGDDAIFGMMDEGSSTIHALAGPPVLDGGSGNDSFASIPVIGLPGVTVSIEEFF